MAANDARIGQKSAEELERGVRRSRLRREADDSADQASDEPPRRQPRWAVYAAVTVVFVSATVAGLAWLSRVPDVVPADGTLLDGVDGVIYRIGDDGTLTWYRHLDPEHGTGTWAPGEGRLISS